MYNISLDIEGKQNKDVAFYNCDLVQMKCYFLKNGKIYQCCIMANIDYFNKYFHTNISYDIDDISIDIFQHTEQEINNFLNTPHNMCKYCNTIIRPHTYKDFQTSKQEIEEWIITI